MRAARSLFLGITALMVVNVIDGLKEVYFGILLQSLDSVVVTFVLFAIAWPVFFLGYITRKRSKNAIHQLTENAVPVRHCLLMLNISSAALWISFLFALKWIEPAIVSALVGGIGIISTLILNKILRPSAVMISADYIAAAIIACASIYLGWASMDGRTAVKDELGGYQVLLGFSMMFVCGVAMALTSILSKVVADHGVSSRYLYAHRFYILLAITGFYTCINASKISAVINHLDTLILLAFAGVILPLLLLQEGIKRCEPVTTESILAAAPLFTIIFQTVDTRLAFSVFSFVGIVLICLAATYNGYSHLSRLSTEGVKI
ncbi:EamA family transporter [Pseudomonas sp. NPDC099000]|uniref:EamA family transporter n=1 Tax=Pseudomonas sp. NPDC099000 TaxID=3364488 RepID=UPI00383A3674